MRTLRAGHYALTLDQARELAVWTWYIHGLLADPKNLTPPETALRFLPAFYRCLQSDRQNRAAMVRICGQVVQSQFTALEAMECLLRKLRPITDYASVYFEVMVR